MKYFILRNTTEQAAYLQDPNGTEPGKKFRAIVGGLIPYYRKNQTVDSTLTGAADISHGSVRKSVKYGVYVVENDEEGYGSLSDLTGYWVLNKPNDTITPLVTLVDHAGTSFEGYLVGDHIPEPQSYALVGSGAYYIVAIEFMLKDPIA